MKKKYVSPSMQTWEIGSVSILATSSSTDNGVNINPDIEVAPASRDEINVRSNNVWDSNW